MKNLFLEYGITLTKPQEKQFDKYAELLVKYNGFFNLTSITDRRDINIKHFIDSAICQQLLIGESLIDIGSGGGFPALPIKIIKPELKITLVDATEKKCEFLKIVAKELNLENVEVICGRAEELAKDPKYREKFDICTARAVARLNILAEYCIPFIKKGGMFVAFKGDCDDEIKEAGKAIETLGGNIILQDKYLLDGAKRTLVVIEKEERTPDRYPRSNAKIKNKPL